MKILLLSLCLMSTGFGWTSQQYQGDGQTSSRSGGESGIRAPSTVGLALLSLTQDWKGGVWISGSAWSLRGLMINDRDGLVSATTVDGTKAISELQFVNSTTGWMVDRRALYRTDDGGISWRKVRIPNRVDVRSVKFFNVQLGWIGGYDGELFRTTDSGQSWKKSELGLKRTIDQICFVDFLHGWATGFNIPEDQRQPRISTLFRTVDGGKSWKVLSNQDADARGSVRALFFLNESVGWAIEPFQHAIVQTLDGGQTWSVKHSGQNGQWTSVIFVNDLEGWASGYGIAHTIDGGSTWQNQVSESTRDYFFEAISFTDNKHGWAVSKDAAFHTADGGNTWSTISDDWKKTIPSFETLVHEGKLVE